MFITFDREPAPSELKDDKVEEDLSDIEKHEAKATKKATYQGRFRIFGSVYTEPFEADSFEKAMDIVFDANIPNEEYPRLVEDEHELIAIENLDTGETEEY